MKTLLAVLVVTVTLGAGSAGAQTPVAVSAADQQGIQATLDGFGSTLTKMDFDSFSALFTDDADFTNIFGMHWTGREQIVKAHRYVFTTRYRGVAQHFTDKSEAILAPGLALVVGKIVMDDFTLPDGKAMTNNQFRMTLVLKKVGGRWLIRSAQNTVIDTALASHDPGLK